MPARGLSRSASQQITGRSSKSKRQALASVHCRLNLLRLDRNMPHQVDGAVLGDDDVVLQPHAEAFLGKVDARLDGEHPAWGEGLREIAQVVNVEPERVAQAMHEELLAGRLVECVL